MLLTLTGDIDLERKRRSGGRRANSERSTAKINQLPQRSVANPYSPMELANPDQIEKLHKSSMRILSELGIRVMSSRVLDIF